MNNARTSSLAKTVEDGEWPGTPETSGVSIDYLTPRNFEFLAKFIEGYAGIRMPPSKKTMVECRLRRRAHALGMNSLHDYCSHLFQRGGLDSEAVNLIDAVTTNKTDFFREPKHFDFLVQEAIPALLDEGYLSRTPLKVWSAACSIGAEPYTLAMVLAELRYTVPDFSILATDISTQVLKLGMQAIYPEIMAHDIPPELRKRYLLRAKRGERDRVRVVPELRRTVRFQRLNLMEAPYTADRNMHVIFCRNILIYFDKQTQRMVLKNICDHLHPGGFLFLGHSETVAGFELPLTQCAASVFRAKGRL
ncbi:MAG: CheR family methyltransferase [Rhodomicrobium sp.]